MTATHSTEIVPVVYEAEIVDGTDEILASFGRPVPRMADNNNLPAIKVSHSRAWYESFFLEW